MVFDMKTSSPLFSNNDVMKKSIIFYDEYDYYERKIRMIQNEFAGSLKQEDAALLLNWISTHQMRIRNA